MESQWQFPRGSINAERCLSVWICYWSSEPSLTCMCSMLSGIKCKLNSSATTFLKITFSSTWILLKTFWTDRIGKSSQHTMMLYQSLCMEWSCSTTARQLIVMQFAVTESCMSTKTEMMRRSHGMTVSFHDWPWSIPWKGWFKRVWISNGSWWSATTVLDNTRAGDLSVMWQDSLCKWLNATLVTNMENLLWMDSLAHTNLSWETTFTKDQ